MGLVLINQSAFFQSSYATLKYMTLIHCFQLLS